jgi:hypothetical protein
MNRIRLALFRDRPAASALQERLLKAGICAEVHDELHFERLWYVSKSASDTRLEVPFEQLEPATKLLCDWDKPGNALSNAVRCPECRSLRVDYPQFTRKSLLTNLVIGLMAEFRIVEKQYYCEQCHCMWPKPGQKPHRHRPHLAPNFFIDS